MNKVNIKDMKNLPIYNGVFVNKDNPHDKIKIMHSFVGKIDRDDEKGLVLVFYRLTVTGITNADCAVGSNSLRAISNKYNFIPE